RQNRVASIGLGECAGEVVYAVAIDLAAAEREVFEAQLAFEKRQTEQAGKTAYHSMLRAAKALVKLNTPNLPENQEQLIAEFRSQFYDTQLFFDPFAGGKFANYLFDAHKKSDRPHTLESSRYLIDEAQLFIDAAHSCNNRLGMAVGASV